MPALTAAQWITRFLAGEYGELCPLEYTEPTPSNAVRGVYAINGPAGVYIGESFDCWNRGTLNMAVCLGLDCGIIRELPSANTWERIQAETEVAKMFASKGFTVISYHGGKLHGSQSSQ